MEIEEIEHKLVMYDLPVCMAEGVYNYLERGIPPGSFLRAVLENDLRGAAGNADANNKNKLYEWAAFCMNELPSLAWGRKLLVKQWIELKGGGKE